MSCVSFNVTGELTVRGDGLDEVLGDESGVADALLLDRPDFTNGALIPLHWASHSFQG